MLTTSILVQTVKRRPWIVALVAFALVGVVSFGSSREFYPFGYGGLFGADSGSGSEEASNPFDGAKFYVDPNSAASNQAAAWRATRPEDAAQIDKIASQPSAYFF